MRHLKRPEAIVKIYYVLKYVGTLHGWVQWTHGLNVPLLLIVESPVLNVWMLVKNCSITQSLNS